MGFRARKFSVWASRSGICTTLQGKKGNIRSLGSASFCTVLSQDTVQNHSIPGISRKHILRRNSTCGAPGSFSQDCTRVSDYFFTDLDSTSQVLHVNARICLKSFSTPRHIRFSLQKLHFRRCAQCALFPHM